MKPNALRDLLAELACDSERESAPSLPEVLALARRERLRRTRFRGSALAAGALAVWLAWPGETLPPASPVVHRSPPKVAPARDSFPIERISDKELLDLLGSTPAALVQMPDGRQQLMLVVAGARRR
jgi:hypothetical protein